MDICKELRNKPHAEVLCSAEPLILASSGTNILATIAKSMADRAPNQVLDCFASSTRASAEESTSEAMGRAGRNEGVGLETDTLWLS